MSLKENIDRLNVPSHVAIIMDGNGRWAKKRGNMRIFGHRNAIAAVKDTVEGAAELGIGYLTLYAFSTENWSRPKAEVDGLMQLLVSTLNSESETLMKNNVRLITIGQTDSLPKSVRSQLHDIMELTSDNTGLNLVLALSYSARWELNQAIKSLLKDFKSGKVSEDEIDDDKIRCYLATAKMPDPELLIRTSGEHRLSNFLLWQSAYTEFYFTDTLWPDFRKENLFEAVLNYQNRERRFGKTSEQVTTDASN